jgi:hypothetical protein
MRKWDAENHLRQCFAEDNPPVPATRYVGKYDIKKQIQQLAKISKHSLSFIPSIF